MRVSDYLHHKASTNKIPLSGCFELSPICNFSCKMCYVRKTAIQVQAEGKQIKQWNEWLELARECKKDGTLYLLLTGGEPFLYPNFKELYSKLHEMGFILSINSNGTLIDYETLEWLKRAAPARINITLYGASPETYQRICGHADGYEKAVSSILKIKETGIPVVINASMIPENSEDMEEILDFGKKHNINVRMSTYMFPPVRRDSEKCDSRFSAETAAEMYLRKMHYQFTEKECQTVLQRQLDSYMKREKKDESWGQCEEYMKCRAGRSSFWVSWDGTMSACGMTPFPVQVSPFQKSFHDCWKELTDQVRSTSVLKKCTSCSLKEVCNPCVAMLYAETGDVNECAPYLKEMAEKTIEKIVKGQKEGLYVEK